MFVVKIGGTNGSGKTSLVRAIISALNMREVSLGSIGTVYVGLPSKELSDIFNRVVVLGSYKNVCGGMDTINNKEEVRELIHHFVDEINERTLVIFEGLITGKTYGYIGELSEHPAQMGKWLYVLMGTPYEECVRRVLGRRNKSGKNLKEFNPDRTMLPTHRACCSTYERALVRGHNGLILQVDNPGAQAFNLFRVLGSICQ